MERFRVRLELSQCSFCILIHRFLSSKAVFFKYSAIPIKLKRYHVLSVPSVLLTFLEYGRIKSLSHLNDNTNDNNRSHRSFPQYHTKGCGIRVVPSGVNRLLSTEFSRIIIKRGSGSTNQGLEDFVLFDDRKHSSTRLSP